MKYSQIKKIINLDQPINEQQHSFSDTDGILTNTGIFIGYNELEMDSNYLDVHEDISYTKDNISLHSHSFWEILYVKSGNLQYLIGDTRYQLHENDIVLVPPGISHRPMFLEKLTEPYHRTVLWVNDDFLQQCVTIHHQSENEVENLSSELYYVIHPTGTLFFQIEQIFNSLLYEKQHSRPGHELFCMGHFAQLLSLYYRLFHYQDTPLQHPEKANLLDDILHYVEMHLSEPISLKSVAEKFLTSQSAISHLFKKQMDISFYRVVTQRRLIEAKNYILAEIPLNEIPDLCGFTDYSVFYKAFKKEYGISPKQFKQHTKA